MPKSDSSNPNGGPSYQGPRYRPNWLAAVLCFVVATYLTAALLNYDPNQSGFHSTSPVGKNWVGWLGADTVWILFYTLGGSTVLLPVALFWMFYIAVRNSRHLVATRVTSAVVWIVSMSGLLAMFDGFKASDTFPKALGG
jgi:S-DNA-T family DNA segregation ATPase FtsK/SpoIIIE